MPIFSAQTKERVWLPDFIRGLAIIMVISFHLAFDLNYFYGWENLNYNRGFLKYMGLTAAILFMGMVGIVTALVFKKKDRKTAIKLSLKRASRLLSIAMLITLITYLTFPDQAIWFGILHLMSVSIFFSLPLAHLGWLNIVLGMLLILGGQWIYDIETEHLFLIPLGLTPPQFSSFDYYPLFPWFGVIVMGTGLGNLLYKKIIHLKSPSSYQKPFIWLGKNSLWIYLLHQPLLLGLLWLIFGH